MSILIKNIDLIQADKSKVLASVNIGIEGDTISFVGDSPEEFRPDRVIDGKDRVAIPGLINAHTHTPMSLLRNYADDLALWEWLNEKIWPFEKNMRDEHVYWGSLLSMAEMISSGVTGFIDMYFHIDAIGEALRESKMRGVISRGLIGLEDSSGEQLREAERFIDKWHGSENGRIRSMVAPHAIYTCPRPYLKEVIEFAKEKKQGIHIHLSESEKELKDCFSENGISPVEYLAELGLLELPTVAAHCVQLSDRDIELLSKYRVAVVNNPTSNMKLGNGFARVEDMIRAGIKLSIGTDGSASNNNLNMFEEMHLVGILNKGVNRDPKSVPSSEVLKMGTINGSLAMGLKNTGRIERGYKADISIIDVSGLHHCPSNDNISSLVYSTQGADVDTVIVDGRILLDKKEHTTIDIEKVKYMVERSSAYLSNKV